MSEPAQGTIGPTPRPTKPWARWVVRLAVVLAVLAPLLIIVGALGTKLNVFDWKVGFGLLTVGWAPKAAMAGLAGGVLAVVAAAFGGWRRLWPGAVAALVLPAAVLAGFGALRAKAQAVPPIHDIATDWREPIMPSRALLAQRGPDANPVQADPRMKPRSAGPEVENWADDRVARIGAESCPGATTVVLPLPRSQAQARVREVLEAEGLKVVGQSDWRLEATATSFWFGFKDDVLVRVRPEGQGSRIDLRSVSRAGVSDLGANCARVTELVDALRG